jgi:hypothetical protein
MIFSFKEIEKILKFGIKKKKIKSKCNSTIKKYILNSTLRNYGFNSSKDLALEIYRVFGVKVSSPHVRFLRRKLSTFSFLLFKTNFLVKKKN